MIVVSNSIKRSMGYATKTKLWWLVTLNSHYTLYNAMP